MFSEAYYLERHPEIAAAVAAGEFRNGYAHFLAFGARELRSPHESFELEWYADQERVRFDIELGKAPDAFTHWLTVGRAEGLLRAPPVEQQITEIQARNLARQGAEALLPVFARAPLRFDCAGPPVVSVVMTPTEGLTATLATLASLRSSQPGDIDLILIDAGASEALRHLSRHVVGATVVRFDIDGGPMRARNAALAFARADAVLFLGGETGVLFGALPAALRRLDSDPSIGAVGGMVLRPHGLLREAGGIVWRDGSLHAYARDEDATAPEANFLRDVDFCSAGFLLVRRAFAETLEGFDEEFESIPYADVDFCLRLRALGHRTMYDPTVRTIDYALDVEPSGRARSRLVERHGAWLRTRPEPDGRATIEARIATREPARVLFIEDTIPLRHLGSGFVRSNDLIATMAASGFGVTVFPAIGNRFDVAESYADMPPSVEVMHNETLDGLVDFLKTRRDYYDTIWIARTHNLDRVRAMFDAIWPSPAKRPKLVLDTEAIASVREAEMAALAGDAFDLEAAIRREFANAGICGEVVAVTEAEAERLRAIGLRSVSVIGHMRALLPTMRAFTERRGLLFLGAIHKTDSPNYDSLVWFAESVLPILEATLGWETRLTVAGHLGADVDLDRFRSHPRITLLGSVAQTEPLYDRHRIFIAPTRFAAGAPYKIHEAASFGLPVVGAALLAEQLGWSDGKEMLTFTGGDAEGMSRAIARLYRDEQLWDRLRSGALDRLRLENDRAGYAASVKRVII